MEERLAEDVPIYSGFLYLNSTFCAWLQNCVLSLLWDSVGAS